MDGIEFLEYCGLDKLSDEECIELVNLMDFYCTNDFDKTYQYNFKVDDSIKVKCVFSTIDIDITKEYQFTYYVNGNEYQNQIVSYKTYNEILSTISSIIRYFIYERKPKSIFLKSNPRIEGSLTDNIKHNIHGQCLKMQIHKVPDYSYKELDNGWLIYKKKN